MRGAKDRLKKLMLWGINNDLGRHNDRNGCMVLESWIERAAKDPEVEAIAQQYVKGLEAKLLSLFDEGIKSGELSKVGSALQGARVFMSGYFGLRLLGRSMRDRMFLEDIANGMIDLL